jgi:mono/diheme cytochrome c family protein
MLKPFLLFSALALILIAPWRVVAAAPQDAATKVKVTADSQAKAKKLYAIDCALCHGETGDGKTDIAKDMQLTLTDWTDPTSLANHPDPEMFKIIREGKGKMPAEDVSRAKDDEIWNLIVYIRGFSKGHTAPPPSTPAPPTAAPGSPAPGDR